MEDVRSHAGSLVVAHRVGWHSGVAGLSETDVLSSKHDNHYHDCSDSVVEEESNGGNHLENGQQEDELVGGESERAY